MADGLSPCGHNEGDVWFDRTLCGVCDGMHYFCNVCGAQQDPCRECTPRGDANGAGLGRETGADA